MWTESGWKQEATVFISEKKEKENKLTAINSCVLYVSLGKGFRRGSSTTEKGSWEWSTQVRLDNYTVGVRFG